MSILVCDETLSKVIKEQAVHLSNNECVQGLKEDVTSNIHQLLRTADLLRRMEKQEQMKMKHVRDATRLLGLPHPEVDLFAPVHMDALMMNERETLFFPRNDNVDLYEESEGSMSVEEGLLPPLSLEVATQPHCVTSSAELTPSLFRYLTVLTQHLTSPDQTLRSEALTEAGSSKRVSHILPFLLQFIETELRSNIQLTGKVTQMLRTYRSIINNNTIYLRPYLPNILDVIYTLCCDWTDSRENTNNPVRIIEQSSDLAAHIILRYSGASPRFHDKYVKFCKETIESDELSLSALGSLTLLIKLGPLSVHDNVLPLVKGLYRDVMVSEGGAPPLTTDHTTVHIRRTITTALFSLYNVLYKDLHRTKMSDLLDTFNLNHVPCYRDNVAKSSDHVTTQSKTVVKENNHVTTDNNHVATNNSNVTTDNSNVAMDNSQITPDHSHVSTDVNHVTTESNDVATCNNDGSKHGNQETHCALLSYDLFREYLGVTMSAVGPNLPAVEGKQPLILSKRLTKEMKRRLTETFQMFATAKGKMLPYERQVFLRKQAVKQIQSNQIYSLHNALAPLQYFL